MKLIVYVNFQQNYGVLSVSLSGLPECFVHWCEVDDGVRVDVVLVQCPPGLVQPLVLTGPPDGVVRPVHGNV